MLEKTEDSGQVLENTAPNEQRQETKKQDFQEFAHHCQVCRKGFTHKGSLFKHKQEHIENRIPEAGVRSVEKEPVIKHNNFKFSEVHACEKCGAVFMSNSLLKEHDSKFHPESLEIEIDNNEPTVSIKQFHCALEESPSCPFQCENKEELKRHIEHKHSGKKDLQCTVCNLYFRNFEDLSRHMNPTHKKNEEP